MQIKVNGEVREVNEGSTMLDLIRSLGVEERVMASALNMEIVKQDAWGNTLLKEGDTIELLDFVGGG
ncbi:MAG: thiamine biosynthesis protein ThiS [Sulfuricurvum sp. RIFOXYD2_FULL_44_160]|uniref:Thiamine biosynthesis protein ThiS n=1 Tax=Sulfuricurvum kujiense TaxID=148813 RepID=A0A2D3WG53_9BACT|nr:MULTISPECIES: sulfur carrier protein ThiS [Sulfuricurvum]OHD91604.1 MAG: thiamine biosynthesis protein ThiS [Sulfuricurvum sp. RIFOXYD2_FULL_44_160]OHD93591.1 MAG: thiamine biosynthesis protein ThiS [Sulfuricurvum sp. RIFOXYD12_FULL_44_77]DAB39398.1 MAG TPA: thiamine biosynthesis protein ThiS [Sulfuricurvum kujiense]